MSIRYLPSRLKKWSLFLFLFLFIGGFATASSGFAACDYLSSGDFSSGSGWIVETKDYWSIYNGMLDVQNNDSGYSSYTRRDFAPSGFFSVDTEISIVNTTGQDDRVGVSISTSGDVLFGFTGESKEYTTHRVICYYYPHTGQLKFKLYDVAEGWVAPLAARSVSGTVQSIGLSMVADGVIFRVNGQDTTYKLTGDLSWGGHIVIDTLKLMGVGAGLHARFDNVCASAYEVTDFPPGNAMPMPSGQDVLATAPAVSPVTSIVPASANPLGFGPVASGGSTLSLSAGLSGLTAPVDLYVGIGVGPLIYLFAADNSLHPLADGLTKWRANTTGGLNNVPVLPPGIDMSGIPGTYDFYFIMAPAGRLDVFRLWVTQLVVGGGSSVVTDKPMEAEVRQNIDLIFGLTSGFTGGLTELSEIFEEEQVVTISPELDLMGILNGAPIPSPITISADFGSGYRMESGSLMSGSAQIVISNVVFGQQGLGADFSGTFSNVMKDGAAFANGQVLGNIHMTEGAGEQAIVSGQITFNNLSISGQQMSGEIEISGTMDIPSELDLSNPTELMANITLKFINFSSGAYTINSGTIDIVSAGSDSITVTTNLQTGAGPVNLNMLLTGTPTGAMAINTTSPGAAGPYTLSMNNVTLDDSCANYPAGGSVSFTSSSTGKTGVVTFTGACDGSYRYSEQ